MEKTLSREIRWFISRQHAGHIEPWFEENGISGKLSGGDSVNRKDYYLILPAVKNLGIKIRDIRKDESGRLITAFEVKQQKSENKSLKLNNHNVAFTCLWEKFSFDIKEEGANFLSVHPENILSDQRWIEVGKERVLALYDAGSGSIVDENNYPPEGCGIELTKIKVAGSLYFSFGLEAFSKSGQHLEKNFKACCHFVFSSDKISGLQVKDSKSYPEWLADICVDR